MSKLAAIFPGQGSQAVGMGHDLAKHTRAAAEVHQVAEQCIADLPELMWHGPIERLTLTAYQQPALVTASIAAYRSYLEAGGLEPDCVAGHSLGEFSALVAAQALQLDDAIRLVHTRGTAMQAAVPEGVGAMAAVMKCDPQTIGVCCSNVSKASGQVVAIANYNSEGQTVISGHAQAVEAVAAELSAQRAKVIMLKVSAPFHCSLMQPAADVLADAMQGLEFSALRMPLIANVTAEPVHDANQLPRLLTQQVTSAVRWSETMQTLYALGVRCFVEFGSGNVLSGLLKRTFKNDDSVTILTVTDMQSLQQALALLKA